MIFGLKIVLLVLYATCATDAIHFTPNNASTTTKKPLRPRLRWPSFRIRYSTSTTKRPTTTTNAMPTDVASLRISSVAVTEPVSEVNSSNKDNSRFGTTLDPFPGFIQSFNTAVSQESVVSSVNHTEGASEGDNATSMVTKTNFDIWDSRDETATLPSIFAETLFNFSITENVLRLEGENATERIQDQKLKRRKLSRNENVTIITSSTVIPKPSSENGQREPVGVYTSESTESHPQDDTPTAVNPTNDVHSGGTYVYVVAIVGVIPTMGMLMCFAKHVFSRPEKPKEISKTSSCNVDFPIAEPRRETIIREHDQTNKVLQPNNTFQSIYTCAQYGSSNIKSSWKRMHLEYPRENLELTEVLGEGNFGIVWKAEAFDMEEQRHCQIVAVKTVKETASYKERQELLRELRIMQLFDDHPNVVRLLGCCTETEPYLLIMEFVKNGKLQSFLREHRSRRKYYNSTVDGLSSRDLTTFAYQVANGMEYISRIGVIHRDLAARNILVDRNNICKVADFGLSRTTEDGDNGLYEQKTKGALPIRWMAPESLYLNVFTSKSDVWAFGILLWEIVTLGSTPYPGMGAREVMHHVQKGNIMECPDHCHPDLYSVMCACWTADPNNRPTFKDLRETLGSHLEIQAGYVDLDHFPESSFYNLYQSPGERV